MRTLVPMRAEPVQQLGAIDRTQVAFEPKLDGFRCILIRDERGVQLQSRHGKMLTRYFPDLARVAREALPRGVTLDGELLIWDASAQATSFSLLGRRITAGRKLAAEVKAHPAHFVAFDLLQVRGQSIMDLPLRKRRVRLERLLARAPLEITVCPQTRDVAQAQMWLTEWAPAGVGIEGIVIKPLDDPYRPGRAGWHKLRARSTAEAIVAGVTGALADPHTLLLARASAEGELRYVGRTGPLREALRRELGQLLRPAGQHPWPVPLPASWQGRFKQHEPLHYIAAAPHLVVEFAADTAFETGRFRHQVKYLRPRIDLAPDDIPIWTYT